MADRQIVPNLPPLSNVKDEATRAALQAIYNSLRVRSGEAGNGERRFVEKWEVSDTQGGGTLVIRNNGGATSGTDSPPVPTPAPTALPVAAIISAVNTSITQSPLWKMLGERIAWVTDSVNLKAIALAAEIKRATNAAFEDASKLVEDIKEGITDIKVKNPDGNGYTALRALKATTDTSSAAIVQLDTVSATSTSANAQATAILQGKVAGAEAAIIQINTIDVTSNSPSAQSIAAMKAVLKDPATGNLMAESYISQINNVSANSLSTNARAVAGMWSTLYDDVTGLEKARSAIVTLNTTTATHTTAIATNLNTVTAMVGQKSAVFFQTTEPVANKNTPPKATDVVLKAGDLWFDTDDKNQPYRWTGTAWAASSDGRIADAAGAVITEKSARVEQDTVIVEAIQTVWGALAGAGSVLVQTGSDGKVTKGSGVTATNWNQVQGALQDAAGNIISSSAIRQEASVALSKAGISESAYTVKIDSDGYVSGYGLASSGARSEFYLRADKFAIGAPVTPRVGFTEKGSWGATTQYYKNDVVQFKGASYDAIIENKGVDPTASHTPAFSAWEKSPALAAPAGENIPFVVHSTAQIINGVTVPAGVYLKNAMIEYLKADQIDTRGLTIKDSSGTVVFGSGTWPAGLSNTAITLNADGSLSGAGGGQVKLESLPAPAGTIEFMKTALNSTNITTYIDSAALNAMVVNKAFINSANINDLAVKSANIDDLQVSSIKLTGSNGGSFAIATATSQGPQEYDFAHLATGGRIPLMSASGFVSGSQGEKFPVVMIGLDKTYVKVLAIVPMNTSHFGGTVRYAFL